MAFRKRFWKLTSTENPEAPFFTTNIHVFMVVKGLCETPSAVCDATFMIILLLLCRPSSIGGDRMFV